MTRYEIHAWVYGTPAPQPRPKVVRATGRAYTPPTADAWKHEIRAAVSAAIAQHPTPGGRLLEGPLRLEVVFWLARPRSHYRTGRNATQLKQRAPTRPHVRPDLDNYVKALLDALGEFQGLPRILFRDDAQVVEIDARKCYTCHNGRPGASVRIVEVER